MNDKYTVADPFGFMEGMRVQVGFGTKKVFKTIVDIQGHEITLIETDGDVIINNFYRLFPTFCEWYTNFRGFVMSIFRKISLFLYGY